MSRHGVRSRVLARLPWGADGLPDRLAAEVWTSSLELGPAPPRRSPLRLRALPGGAALVATTDGTVHVLVQVGTGAAVRSALPARGDLLDAVIAPAGDAVVLEEGRLLRVGPPGWEREAAGRRLLLDNAGRLLLVAGDVAHAVDLATGAPGDRPALGEPFLAGDRIARVAYDPEREERLWVLEGAEPVRGRGDAWGFLGAAIGADARGRAYGVLANELARVDLDGAVDWRLALDKVELDDGYDALQPPGTDAVTADGDVLAAVVGDGGIAVVALTPA